MRKTFPDIVKYVNLKDVILLENEQWVYCYALPIYFQNRCNPFDSRLVSGLVQVGIPTKKMVSTDALREKLNESITDMFLYYHIPLNPEVLDRYLKYQIPDVKDEPLLVPAGLYQVDEIVVERIGRKFYCSTYMPSKERPAIKLYFNLESYQAANHDVVKVVKNPDQYIGQDVSKIFFSTLG